MRQLIASSTAAQAIVREAGLAGDWYPYGTADGFADWLYLNRSSADPQALTEEIRGYLSEWLMGNNRLVMDAALRSDVEYDEWVAGELAFACKEASALLVNAQASPEGRKVFSALRYLATSSGRSFGPRGQTVSSLMALCDLLDRLGFVLRSVPEEILETQHERYRSPRRADWARFAKVTTHLIESPLNNFRDCDRTVSLLVGLVDDRDARCAMDARLAAARMERVAGIMATSTGSGYRRSPRHI